MGKKLGLLYILCIKDVKRSFLLWSTPFAQSAQYYAIRTFPRMLMGAGGPACNAKQQVLYEADGKVVDGLYIAGEMAGYAILHSTGSGNVNCIVYGKQAGQMAAHEALYRRL